MGISVFQADHDKVWAHSYHCTLEVTHLSGGVPNDPKIMKGWLQSRIGKDKQEVRDTQLMQLVEATAIERGVSVDEATEFVMPSVNGFKRDEGGLVFEGRCVKAAVKEYFNIALGGGHLHKAGKAPRMGATGKGVMAFVAEHVQIPESFIPLCNIDTGEQFVEPDFTDQRFVSTFRGQSISYCETLNEASMSFTVESDWPFTRDEWSTVWLIGEENGIGSMRSQGSGKFKVVRWDAINPAAAPKVVKNDPEVDAA